MLTRFVIGVGGMGMIMAAAPAAMSDGTLEQAIKASYLTKFAPFIGWPAEAFAGPKGALTICISGQDPFGSILDDVARGQKADAHPIVLRRLTGTVPRQGCHILLVGHPNAGGAPLAEVAGLPVLTVTDKSEGVTGGMIQFVKQGGRIRFEINEAAARASGMTISSKLLGLALSVNRR